MLLYKSQRVEIEFSKNLFTKSSYHVMVISFNIYFKKSETFFLKSLTVFCLWWIYVFSEGCCNTIHIAGWQPQQLKYQ